MLLTSVVIAIRDVRLAGRIAGGGCLGLIAGSYLATVLVRWPQGLSANRGRSRCDGCGRRLAWYELVPLASYLHVHGRCRTCRVPISPLHPLVEAGCGLLGAYFFGVGAPLLAPLAWVLLLLALFDARLLWLPDRLVAVLALVCLAEPSWRDDTGMGERVVGGAIGFGSLWAIATVHRRLTGRDGLGGGDAKLFGALGLWLGARDLPQVMVIACAIGLLDAAMRWPRNADRREVQLPLGAYLCVASLGFVASQPLLMGP